VFRSGENASTVIGQPSFNAEPAPSLPTPNGLSNPVAVAFDSHLNLWVVDGPNQRVLRYQPPFKDGMNADLVIGQPDFTTRTPIVSQSGLYNPIGIRFDSSGNLWVVNSAANRVLEYSPPFSNGMNAALVIGQNNFTSDTSAITQNGLSGPTRVAFDPLGNLWVSDNNRVLEYSPPFSNGMNAALVIGQNSFTTFAPATSQDGLQNPTSIAFDAHGNLWIADTGNNRVIEFKPPFISGMNADLVIGQNSFTTLTPATSQNGLWNPIGIAFDKQGNLWVADPGNNRVIEFIPPFISGMNAALVIGQNSFTTNTKATGKNGLVSPNAVALGLDTARQPFEQTLWVSDYGNARVLEFRQAQLIF
jgi:sugar lactone lactonase YvrE